MSKILISYRREDSEDVTGRIYDRLIREFDRASVFLDVDSIPLGVDFRTYLDAQVAKCHVFLAVIGRDWLKTTKGSKGKSRLDDPKDFVRIEIESALKRGIPVIPVLVRGASIPAAEWLPASIQDLSFRNGIAIRAGQDFHRDMDKLIEYLKGQIQISQEDHTEQDRAVLSAGGDVTKRLSAQDACLIVEYEEGKGSFYQESPIQKPGLGKGTLQLCRIKVQGNRLVPVEDVQVKVQQVLPIQDNLHGLPCHIQRMNDNVPPYSRSTVFAKGQEEYFDVLGYAQFMMNTGELHIRRIDGAPNNIDEEPCEVLIRITGKGIEPIDGWFRVWIDSHNNLHMTWRDNHEAISSEAHS